MTTTPRYLLMLSDGWEFRGFQTLARALLAKAEHPGSIVYEPLGMSAAEKVAAEGEEAEWHDNADLREYREDV